MNVDSKSLTKYWQIESKIQILYYKESSQSSHGGAGETNLTRNHEVMGLILGLTQWVEDPALL